MTESDISLTSVRSFLASESINQTSAPTMGKNTFMRYSQAIYIATLVILGVCGNILCAIVFSTKSLK